MRYYSNELHEFEFSQINNDLIGYGCCSNVYRLQDKIFKLYFEYTNKHFRISQDIFEILKDIDNPNFIKLFNFYITEDAIGVDSYLFKLVTEQRGIEAYTAKYYKKSDLNPLDINKDYLLDNIRRIEELFNILSHESIIVDDIKLDNLIITNSDIVLIDPDCYFIDKKSELSKIIKSNKLEILKIISDLYTKLSNINNPNAKVLIKQLIDIEVCDKTDISYELSKKLGRYRTPIEYIKENL